MEANAPEKIWIDPTNDLSKLSGHIDKGSVEYIRADAFIEKAADYIKKDMLDNLAFQGRLNRIEIIDGIIEKFIKAMKDE
jgi:hypothetical protein